CEGFERLVLRKPPINRGRNMEVGRQFALFAERRYWFPTCELCGRFVAWDQSHPLLHRGGDWSVGDWLGVVRARRAWVSFLRHLPPQAGPCDDLCRGHRWSNRDRPLPAPSFAASRLPKSARHGEDDRPGGDFPTCQPPELRREASCRAFALVLRLWLSWAKGPTVPGGAPVLCWVELSENLHRFVLPSQDARPHSFPGREAFRQSRRDQCNLRGERCQIM